MSFWRLILKLFEQINKTRNLIILLVLIDQVTKIIVNIFFRNISFRILWGRIGFEIYLNKYYMSVFNSYFNFNLSILTLTIMNLFILFFLSTFYLYVLKQKALDIKIRTCLSIVIATCVCSIVDKIFWGGSLDFIVFFGYIIDIKDILLCVGVILGSVLYVYKYEIRKINLEEIENLSYSGYFKYLLEFWR